MVVDGTGCVMVAAVCMQVMMGPCRGPLVYRTVFRVRVAFVQPV